MSGMELTPQTCGGCRYFKPVWSGWGECHRFPPVVVWAIINREGCQQSEPTTTRPLVAVDDFCGEFKVRAFGGTAP
jgi:NAD-dependent dihydropyrimidine dehydrogenase PreA subunit